MTSGGNGRNDDDDNEMTQAQRRLLVKTKESEIQKTKASIRGRSTVPSRLCNPELNPSWVRRNLLIEGSVLGYV